jgi:hypothetical protein
MIVLQESPEYFIQQCEECGAILKYSLHDIHPEAAPYYDEDGEIKCIAGFESIMCPCCKEVIPATKTWFYESPYISMAYNFNFDSKNR